MAGPFTSASATGDAISDTISELFDIPFYDVQNQMADSLTLGAESYETGKADAPSDDSLDPFGF